MTNATRQNGILILSRAEIYYLMKLLRANAMIGLGAAESAPAVLDRGRVSLVQRGLVTTGLTEAENKIDDKLLPLVMASFFPDGAMTIIRDLPAVGEQVLLFFRRASLIVLHTFPDQFSHRLALLDNPAQVTDMVQRWFPLAGYPESRSNVQLAVERFKELRDEAEAHRTDAALQVLAGCPFADDEKMNLIEAIEHRTISGSFAVMQCVQDTITTAHSVAVVAGPSTAWLISQPEDDPQGSQLLIRRIGADLVDVVAGLMERM